MSIKNKFKYLLGIDFSSKVVHLNMLKIDLL